MTYKLAVLIDNKWVDTSTRPTIESACKAVEALGRVSRYDWKAYFTSEVDGLDYTLFETFAL